MAEIPDVYNRTVGGALHRRLRKTYQNPNGEIGMTQPEFCQRLSDALGLEKPLSAGAYSEFETGISLPHGKAPFGLGSFTLASMNILGIDRDSEVGKLYLEAMSVSTLVARIGPDLTRQSIGRRERFADFPIRYARFMGATA